MIKDHFEEVIGQDRIKPALNLYVESYKKNGGFLMPLFLAAPRGAGKTKICRKMAQALSKKTVEINGASIKKLSDFVDQIIVPHVVGNQRVTLFIDEIHSVDSSVLDWLLTVLSLPDGTTKTKNYHSGSEYEFDFKKFSFLCASTNPELLSLPFLSRLNKIELDKYNPKDLKTILLQVVANKSFTIESGVDDEIVSVSRDNPRTLVENIGRHLKLFCSTYGVNTITIDRWNQFRTLFNVKELGLTTMELDVLEFLYHSGPQSLTSISAKLGVDASTVRRNTELYLLSKGLIQIDGKRKITGYGINLLKKNGTI